MQRNNTEGIQIIVADLVSNIAFDGGTCKCANASAGDKTIINGTTYTVVDNTTIAGQIAAGNVNLCTTLVTDMSELFKGNTSFNSNIGFWDTSNVTNMSGTMSGTSFNQDIGSWDTSKVTDMMDVCWCFFNSRYRQWNTSSVTNMLICFIINLIKILEAGILQV